MRKFKDVFSTPGSFSASFCFSLTSESLPWQSHSMSHIPMSGISWIRRTPNFSAINFIFSDEGKGFLEKTMNWFGM